VARVPLDHEGNVPLYRQLADALRRQIDSGEIPVHRPIPSKKMLVQQYGVAPGTVERALDVLKAEGLLESVQGKGLYVTPRSTWLAP
jgi:DNA-binding GntR family transcriptional regulator